MEFKHYLLILRRWAWLLVLGLVLGALAGYGFSRYQTPVYRSTTKMLVVRANQSQNSDLAYLSNQELGQTFIQLLKTSQILDPAAEQLDFNVNSDQITASLISGTQLISLQVEDTSPERAALIANTLVEVLIEQNDNLQSSRYKSNEASLNAQVEQVQGQIDILQDEINQLTTANVQEQTAKVEAKIAELQSEIAQLEYEVNYYENLYDEKGLAPPELTARLAQLKSTLGVYQGIYSNLVVGNPTENGNSAHLEYLQKSLDLYQQIHIQLLGDLEEVRLAHLQNTPNIVQIEPASVPSRPIRPLPLQNTLLAAAVGLMLAGGIVFLIEYMDDTLRSPVDVEQVLGVPVLGYIAEIKNPDKESRIHVSANPRSPVAEAFRTLRASIELSGDQPPKTILVTSSRTGEGKTTIAANLAAIFSQSGKRVILVDADLRRPAVHSAVGIPNRLGLSTLLRDSLQPKEVWKSYGNGHKSMSVITSGYIPDNPAELLGSDRMLHLMADLRKHADIVIFDAPPILVADVQILASLVDGVILVLRPGKSPAEEAKSTLIQLNRSGASVMGVIFNRIPRKGGKHYGAYGYYSANAYKYYAKNEPREGTRYYKS
jgi:capsular exopolysaccharide synthesis family protein